MGLKASKKKNNRQFARITKIEIVKIEGLLFHQLHDGRYYKMYCSAQLIKNFHVSLTKLTTLFKAKLKWLELGEHEIFKSSLLLDKLSSCRIHFSFKYSLKSLLVSSYVLPCREKTT